MNSKTQAKVTRVSNLSANRYSNGSNGRISGGLGQGPFENRDTIGANDG